MHETIFFLMFFELSECFNENPYVFYNNRPISLFPNMYGGRSDESVGPSTLRATGAACEVEVTSHHRITVPFLRDPDIFGNTEIGR